MPVKSSPLDFVDKVTRIQEPYKKANRKFHPDDSVINVGGALIGGGHFAVMAGPCSVETPEQVLATAKACKEAGATILRGGAFKPRTSHTPSRHGSRRFGIVRAS